VARDTGWRAVGNEQKRSVRGRRLSTVRAKLTVLATALVAATLGLSALGLVLVQERLLMHGIDESLIQRADNIEGDVARGTLGSRLPGEGDPEDLFTQVIGPDGRVAGASANAADLPAASNPLDPGTRDSMRSVSGIRGSDEFRILARPVETGDGSVTLVVAKNLDDVHESVRILTWSLAVSFPVATLLLTILVWWLTGRVLHPVEAIRAEVASISGTELHRRVPVPRTHDEISSLAQTMNEMLRRMEQATEQQQRFVADASHELRGPLTRIRSALEVAKAHPDVVDDETLHQSLLTETEALSQLVDDLLFLARSEAGALGHPTETVDLDDLVLDEARRLRDRGANRVVIGSVSAARALGDPRQLTRAIRNLASNAERHASSTVTFELREDGDTCELVVADDGAGIPREHHRTVFERFTRLDEARSRDAGGFGLGLAIVQDIVTRHGGSIEIATQDGGGARFVLTLPRAD
jgi:signal transduction histidine kinase